jgi:acyl-[acyl-carrier-protein] desaturase
MVRQDRIYREYLGYLKTAEKKRRWNIFHDIPWNKLDPAKAFEKNAQRIEIFCAEELYVPDYSARGLELMRPSFGMAWFQTCWAAEEARHGLVFREYLMRSGLRSQDYFVALEAEISAREWQLPFATARQMTCYGALQEGATYLAYKAQKELARQSADPVLAAIYALVAWDEAAHGAFYRSIAGLEMLDNRKGTMADLAWVLNHFQMPGESLIHDYRKRLTALSSGISPREFLMHVVWPLLKTLNIGREEFRSARTATADRDF